jgi:hypothetical protein
MKKVILGLLLMSVAFLTNAQETIKLGKNEIKLAGQQITEVPMVPNGDGEEDDRTKVVTYMDITEIFFTFTQITYNANGVANASVYDISVKTKLKATVGELKSKKYKAGIVYYITFECPENTNCVIHSYYDAYLEMPNIMKESSFQVFFTNKKMAEDFAKVVNESMQ